MGGITILSVRVVDYCSKHSPEGHPIARNKDGSIIPDKQIACLSCNIGDA